MVSQSIDPKYMQLYREYSSAIRAFENATKDRARVRAAADKARRAPPRPRRPVGSPGTFRMSPRAQPAARPAPQGGEQKIYLGKILGWAKIIYTSPPAPAPAVSVDTSAVHDNISLKMFWNAKNRYEKSRQAFFEYVRRQNIEIHRGRAKQALGHAANLQYLGVEGGGEESLHEAQAEVEKACQNAWAIYQNSPPPKSDEMKILLLESCADAQMVGLDESSIAQKMEREIVMLFNAGELTMVKK